MEQFDADQRTVEIHEIGETLYKITSGKFTENDFIPSLEVAQQHYQDDEYFQEYYDDYADELDYAH